MSQLPTIASPCVAARPALTVDDTGPGEAQQHLTMARENSTTRQDRELYAAKL